MTENNIPKSIAIIMDGNGRWAQRQGFKIRYGHKKGADALIKILNHCNKIGVESLTVFAFSTENWKRPQSEVNALMRLLEYYLFKLEDELQKNNIKLKVIGASAEGKLNKKIIDRVKEVEENTKNNRFAFNIAFNYGGRKEIVDASKKIAQDIKNGVISIDDINENSFKNYLYNPDIIYPDLVIRTGGDLRISNFLLWEMSYSELYFTDTLWPDFDEKQLDLRLQRDFAEFSNKQFSNSLDNLLPRSLVSVILNKSEIVNNTKAGTDITVTIKRSDDGEYKEKELKVTLKTKETLDGLESDSDSGTENNNNSQSYPNQGNGSDGSDNQILPW